QRVERARALGSARIHDPALAELGFHPLRDERLDRLLQMEQSVLDAPECVLFACHSSSLSTVPSAIRLPVGMTVGLDLCKLPTCIDRPAYLAFALTIKQETCEGLIAPFPYPRPDEHFGPAR